MFGIVRILMGGFVFGACVLTLKYQKRFNKKNLCIAMFIVIVFSTLLYMIPLENLFFTFETPEKAFNYINFEEVAAIVDGKDSTMVIGEKGERDYVSLIIPKSLEGWKLGRGIDTKLKEQSVYNGMAINIYQYNKSDDYFIAVFNLKGGNLEIKDSCDSFFVSIGDDETVYFANIVQYEGYWININGQQFTDFE